MSIRLLLFINTGNESLFDYFLSLCCKYSPGLNRKRTIYVLDSDRYLFTDTKKKYPFITSLEEFMLDCDQSRCVYEYIIGIHGPMH